MKLVLRVNKVDDSFIEANKSVFHSPRYCKAKLNQPSHARRVLAAKKHNDTPNYVKQTGIIQHLSSGLKTGFRHFSVTHRPIFSMQQSRRTVYIPLRTTLGSSRPPKFKSQISSRSFIEKKLDGV